MTKLSLQPFEPIVDFLADFLGQNAEVVLHNLSDLEQSIYKIRNGNITGRKVGDPITDLVAKAIKLNDSSVQYRANYKGRSKNGQELKCATCFIRDENNNIVGALCINMAVDDFLQAKMFIDSFLQHFNEQKDEKVQEHIGMTVPEMIDTRIDDIIMSFSVSRNTLTKDDKQRIVEELNNEGVFLLKGTILRVAKELELSEPTVYKYLQKVK
ncbi:helix-turn-helix transcriptional regulator [Escherichia coli]|uniref:helix-turn-helix transcriptional regulator n=1 Tax=Escherichia coli TaxID=562 RepID=UPI003B3402A1